MGKQKQQKINIIKRFFFDLVKDNIINDIKNSFYNIRIELNKIKKKTLKNIYNHIIFEKDKLYQYDIFYQWYDLICDIIDSKLYKPPIIKETKKAPKFVCAVNFINKGMDKIGSPKLLIIKNI